MTLVDIAERLLPRDDPEAGALLREQLEGEGVEMRLEAKLERVEPGFGLHLEGGTVEAERLLVATGRDANVEGFGFEHLGSTVSKQGIEVDDRLRASDGVWAIGDVNGIAMFTHVGKYQARVAAADMAGLDAHADYRAIPAVTFTDPQIASVGRTSGDDLVVGRKIGGDGSASTYERPKRPGFLKVFADPKRASWSAPSVSARRPASGSGSSRLRSSRDPRRSDSRHHPAVPDVLRSRLLRRP